MYFSRVLTSVSFPKKLSLLPPYFFGDCFPPGDGSPAHCPLTWTMKAASRIKPVNDSTKASFFISAKRDYKDGDLVNSSNLLVFLFSNFCLIQPRNDVIQPSKRVKKKCAYSWCSSTNGRKTILQLIFWKLLLFSIQAEKKEKKK